MDGLCDLSVDEMDAGGGYEEGFEGVEGLVGVDLKEGAAAEGFVLAVVAGPGLDAGDAEESFDDARLRGETMQLDATTLPTLQILHYDSPWPHTVVH
jgi:hypothetical protein